MNLKNILWVRNTGKIVPNAPIADNLFGMKLSGGDVITTATGNPVSIVTNKAQNAISTLLSYSPKQSGTGDPSPSNVRPIEGWTESNLGVNSETPTTTISLGGTYYGFEIDVERGVLRVTHREKIEFTGGDEESWKRHYDSVLNVNQFWCDNIKIQSAPVSSCYSNIAPYGATASTRNRYPYGCYTVTSGTEIAFQMAGSIETIYDVSLWKAYLSEMYANGTPVCAVYELATPIELPLTPQTVALLAGANTLWTDGDEVSVTYKAKRG